jgi:hypothetical protein
MTETVHRVCAARLLKDFSLEMTGKDTGALDAARDAIPPGTRINVTFLENEDLPMRLAAARAIKSFGFVPVPHISARRLRSAEALEEFAAALAADGAIENVFASGTSASAATRRDTRPSATGCSGRRWRRRPRPCAGNGCPAPSSRSSASTPTRFARG